MKQHLIILTIIFICNISIANEYNLTAESNCDTDSTNTGYDTSKQTWYGICDNINISGTYICSSQSAQAGQTLDTPPPFDTSNNRGAINGNCWCKLTTPYSGAYWVSTGHTTIHDYSGNYAEAACIGTSWPVPPCPWRCARLWNQTTSGYNAEYGHKGYYTDEDLAKVKAALFATPITETPCTIGISHLVTSTNLSFKLWAKKYTNPSMVIQYNNQKCYGKLKAGQQNNAINIKIDNTVYHLTN